MDCGDDGDDDVVVVVGFVGAASDAHDDVDVDAAAAVDMIEVLVGCWRISPAVGSLFVVVAGAGADADVANDDYDYERDSEVVVAGVGLYSEDEDDVGPGAEWFGSMVANDSVANEDGDDDDGGGDGKDCVGVQSMALSCNGCVADYRSPWLFASASDLNGCDDGYESCADGGCQRLAGEDAGDDDY